MNTRKSGLVTLWLSGLALYLFLVWVMPGLLIKAVAFMHHWVHLTAHSLMQDESSIKLSVHARQLGLKSGLFQ